MATTSPHSVGSEWWKRLFKRENGGTGDFSKWNISEWNRRHVIVWWKHWLNKTFKCHWIEYTTVESKWARQEKKLRNRQYHQSNGHYISKYKRTVRITLHFIKMVFSCVQACFNGIVCAWLVFQVIFRQISCRKFHVNSVRLDGWLLHCSIRFKVLFVRSRIFSSVSSRIFIFFLRCGTLSLEMLEVRALSETVF